MYRYTRAMVGNYIQPVECPPPRIIPHMYLHRRRHVLSMSRSWPGMRPPMAVVTRRVSRAEAANSRGARRLAAGRVAPTYRNCAR